ncbi:MAG: hypothetical protein ACMUEM_01290 [Flavobacteriales bacterium AspAUS03]
MEFTTEVKISSIATGPDFTLALSTNGTIYSWKNKSEDN